MVDKLTISARFQAIQDAICAALEAADGAQFKEDLWTRAEGGGGRTRILEGNVIEKGGVLFSEVYGPLPDAIAKSMQLQPTDFFATGVSIVLHPKSPLVPIIHMNVRYFETTGGDKWWFGGGIDLTPHYVDEADARFFHQALKSTCDRYHQDFYTQFKANADDYFFIKHRKETRGIGGIFFDYQDEKTGLTKEQLFDFVVAVGETFAPTYTHLMHKNKNSSWTAQEKHWQMLRRGRYVEFNLVWDRGTKFGLETNGRTESILMSMPPCANWVYNFQPEADSPEAATLNWLRKGVDWV
jgi:coproporphyrinogen III oxidase